MNLVFIFADQMRAGSCGFDGHPTALTPNLDRLAATGIQFNNCISGTPVCTPWRACFLTGQYPLTHGLFVNDVRLPTDRPTLGDILKQAGFSTGYIGKWHLDGPDRGGFIPPGPRRQGFDFWATANCSHSYFNSHYYKDSPEVKYWSGYDAIAQTDEAIRFINKKSKEASPFVLVMSWGPPHGPYEQVPDKYLDEVSPESVFVPPNCPEPVREDLRAYQAHIHALDEQIGRLEKTLKEQGILEDTIFVFTSDHGDMLGSQRHERKQLPWNESLRVPFLIRAPGQFAAGGKSDALLNVWDLLPTLLGILDIECPSSVQGQDLSEAICHADFSGPDSTFACSISPFSEYQGEAWRAVITKTHSYVRRLDGPWLLYDNRADPFQMNNLVNRPEHAELQAELECKLKKHLELAGDDFQASEIHLKRWGYEVDENGAIPYFTSLA